MNDCKEIIPLLGCHYRESPAETLRKIRAETPRKTRKVFLGALLFLLSIGFSFYRPVDFPPPPQETIPYVCFYLCVVEHMKLLLVLILT